MKQALNTSARVLLRRAALLVLLVPACLCAQVPPADPVATPSSSSGEDIIAFLNQTVVWYRQLTVQQQLASEPSDVMFLNDNRQIAGQAVRLAFDFARARAQALAAETPAGTQSQAGGSLSQYQRLVDRAARAEQQVKQSQQELETLKQQLASATGKRRSTLQASIAEAQGELDLFLARRDTLRGMVQFATSATSGGTGSGSLAAQIEELARAVPTASSSEPGGTSGANTSGSLAAASPEHRSDPSGMLALMSDLLSLRRKLRALDDNIQLTDALAQSSRGLRAPLVSAVRELNQQGDQLAAQPPSQDSVVLAQQRKDLAALTAQYKQVSASLLPLGKQNILLDVYKRTSLNWRGVVEDRYDSELKALLLRLAGLVVILGVVVAISELWKRATFRYITDARRRYQFLLLRRIVLWLLLAIIIVVAFASELGAITTFAGLLTAGIAVALQNVILSVAGYFFLIGKYGVRVGDRVQVAGVTGDVVDIGLVRLHLMEVTGGASPRPTGRVVVFSNAVVFQANAGLFKQIPGTSFLWHEITLNLGPESDYREAEQRMLAAVNKVLDEYREKLEQQRRTMERSLHSVTISDFTPESRLHLKPSGLDIVIRYPVDLSHAAEIDDRITRALLDAIEHEPRLRLLGSAGPAETAEKQPA